MWFEMYLKPETQMLLSPKNNNSKYYRCTNTGNGDYQVICSIPVLHPHNNIYYLQCIKESIKGVVDCFFSRLDCVYGVQSNICSCYFSHNLPLSYTALSLL